VIPKKRKEDLSQPKKKKERSLSLSEGGRTKYITKGGERAAIVWQDRVFNMEVPLNAGELSIGRKQGGCRREVRRIRGGKCKRGLKDIGKS